MSEEINGYIVEEWNVHNFPIGGKTTGRFQTTCPFCSQERKKKQDKCATVNLDTAYFSCWHCGEEGQLHSYKRQNQEEKKYEMPPEQEFTSEYSENLLKWFGSRKISKATLQKFKITEGQEWMPQTGREMNCVKFNYFLQNRLVNIKYRDSKKNFKLFKGAEKIMYNLDAIFGKNEAVIVEGEIDALSYYEAGVPNVVSVPNGFNLQGALNLDYISSCYEYFENLEKIYLAVDNDEAGQHGQKELARRFGNEKIWLVDFKDCKDANEYLIKYGAVSLQETLSDAQPIPLENVVTVKNKREELREFYLNGNKEGYKTGLPSFDDIFSLYLGMAIVVTGLPSSGKSDFVDELCVRYNLMHGWKTAFASPENYPVKLHMDKVLRKFSGFIPKTPEQLDSIGWTAVEDRVDENFFFIEFEDGFHLDKAIKKLEELIKRKGVRVIVLDPFNKIRLKTSLGKSITDYTNDYLTILDNFARKHNILLFIVAHPTKPPRINGKREEPDMYSIKGGGEWYDMMPNGLLVHRDYDRNIVKVKILKVKFSWLGENNAETWFGWNFNNGRYTELNGEVTDEDIQPPTPLWNNRNWLVNEEPAKETDEELPEKKELPTASPEDAFGPPDEVPDEGISDDAFLEDPDVPF